MPEGPDGKTIIIVKKVSGHGGHHGGAWKVAYADFVTAMMALFLTLWLVNSASVVTREAIASYFKRPGVFEKGSGTPLEIGGGGILPDTFAPPADAGSEIVPTKRIYKPEEGEDKPPVLERGGGDGTGTERGRSALENEEVDFERIARELETSIRENRQAVQGAIGQIGIKIDQRGLHLEIMDTPTASMFAVGSDQIKQDALGTVEQIGKILAQLPNPIDIEGHTDATPFRTGLRGQYDNWDLSTDRANAARRVLESAGLEQWQIARVVGYADKRPKVAQDPIHPSNRRISISMRFTEQAAQSLSGKQTVVTHRAPQTTLKSSEEVQDVEEEKVKVQSGPVTNEYLRQLESVLPIDEAPPSSKLESKFKDSSLDVELEIRFEEEGIIQQSTEAQTDSQPILPEMDMIFGDDNPFNNLR
jgi:chemotaxis protein MotB